MIRRAVILCGGKGTRLRPYTVALPKPLIPIGDYPILEVIIRQLARQNFHHVTLAVNHQAELIRAFFGDGKKWNLKIDYLMEEKPLGTMGALRLIPDLPENFLVLNGDILTNLNFGNLLNYHKNHKALFTISGFQRKEFIDYGVLHVCHKGFLRKFREKPCQHYLVSMGIYGVNKKILRYIPKKPFGFDHLMYRLLQKKDQVHVKTFIGYWMDIGRPEDFEQATRDFMKLGLEHFS